MLCPVSRLRLSRLHVNESRPGACVQLVPRGAGSAPGPGQQTGIPGFHSWQPTHRGDALHRHRLGLQLDAQTAEFQDEDVAQVGYFPLARTAETLAWRAANDQIQVAGFQPEIVKHPRAAEFADITEPEVLAT